MQQEQSTGPKIFYTKETALLPDNYTMRFSIWDIGSGGTINPNRVWWEEKNINLTTSTISTFLGNQANAGLRSGPLGDLDFSQQYWVQVEKLEADGTTYTPVGARTKFSFVPYAMYSLEAASGGSVTSVTAGNGLSGTSAVGDITLSIPTGGVKSAMLAANSVTEGKIALNAVTDPKILGPISSFKIEQGAGSSLNADMLDGAHAAAFLRKSNPVVSGDIEVTGNIKLPFTTATDGIIKMNTYTLIHSFGSNSFFAGAAAGNLTLTGYDNTGVGQYALNALSTGYGNTALGRSSLRYNTTGGANTALGSNTMQKNISGIWNTAVGTSSLYSNTIGKYNSALGGQALYSNTTAGGNTAVGSGALRTQDYSNGGAAWDSYNTAVGTDALRSNNPTSTNTGVNNTAVGAMALRYNSTGIRNVAVGAESLKMNGTGGDNTAIGTASLYSLTSGAFNVAIGTNSGSGLTTGTLNIYIGSVGAGASDENDTIRIGGSQTRSFIKGIYGSIAIGGSAVYVTSAGQLGTLTSSGRFKEDIKDMGDSTSNLMKLRPVSFYYRPEYAEGPRLLQYGLIAEEVAEVYPDLVQYSENGEPNSVYYQFVNAMLLNEVQKQHSEIEDLKARLAKIEALLGSR